MGRPKGQQKTGGRKPGSPNKVKSELRSKIKDFGEENLEEVIAAWQCLTDPKDKIKTYLEIIAYAVPKLQAVQVDANIQRQSSVEDDLKALAEES